jgi:hypothetical protein
METSGKIRGANARNESLFHVMHGLGASAMGGLLAFGLALAGTWTVGGPHSHPWLGVSAFLVTMALHYHGYLRVREQCQGSTELILADALLSEALGDTAAQASADGNQGTHTISEKGPAIVMLAPRHIDLDAMHSVGGVPVPGWLQRHAEALDRFRDYLRQGEASERVEAAKARHSQYQELLQATDELPAIAEWDHPERSGRHHEQMRRKTPCAGMGDGSPKRCARRSGAAVRR